MYSTNLFFLFHRRTAPTAAAPPSRSGLLPVRSSRGAVHYGGVHGGATRAAAARVAIGATNRGPVPLAELPVAGGAGWELAQIAEPFPAGKGGTARQGAAAALAFAAGRVPTIIKRRDHIVVPAHGATACAAESKVSGASQSPVAALPMAGCDAADVAHIEEVSVLGAKRPAVNALLERTRGSLARHVHALLVPTELQAKRVGACIAAEEFTTVVAG
jgi:hypothetical protein